MHNDWNQTYLLWLGAEHCNLPIASPNFHTSTTILCHFTFSSKWDNHPAIFLKLLKTWKAQAYIMNERCSCPVLTLQPLFSRIASQLLDLFPQGTCDMNTTWTAKPGKGTFQSTTTTENQTSNVRWPDVISCPVNNPKAWLSLLLFYLLIISNSICHAQTNH